MELIEKKKVLLHLIEDADEKLTGLLLVLADEYNAATQNYTKEELDFFEKRRNTFFSNKTGATVEEAHNRIRSNYQNGL
ncbi:MAG: hypothetical protein ABJA35_03250 [Parafilimonas sp.]